MLYHLHNAGQALRAAAHATTAWGWALAGRAWPAAWLGGWAWTHDLVKPYPKPAWDLATPAQVVWARPFADLVRFPNPGAPKLLVVAPLAGHHATILRPTLAEFLPDHDVYVTDWRCASRVPAAAGRFGLDDCVEYLQDFLRAVGPDTHVLAVCQPGPATLVAAALEADGPAAPASVTLLAAPVDTRVSPGAVNRCARLPWSVFRSAIHRVPAGAAGAGRNVYPGFLQLSGFLSLDPLLHGKALARYARHLWGGETAKAAKHQAFYDEYYAVMDLPARFYLETIRAVFREHQLPCGTWTHRGAAVDLGALTAPLLTVEGGKDAITGPGQTHAAHELCASARHHAAYVEPGVGHYGVFSGHAFRARIAPRIKRFIREGV